MSGSGGKAFAVAGVAAVAAGAALAALGPAALALAVICVVVPVCARQARRARAADPPADSGLRYHLCAYGVLYLVPIGAALALQLILSLVIGWAGDSLPLSRLIAAEQLFTRISTFFADNLKLQEITVLAVLAGIYLLSCVLLSGGRAGSPRRRRGIAALHRAADLYTRYSGPAAAGLATLAAFTFFGLHLGEPARDLRLRIKVAQDGYAEVARKVEARLSERVAGGLHDKIRNGFPVPYQAALARTAEVLELAATLRRQAEAARAAHDVRVPAVERALAAAARGGGPSGGHLRIAGTERPATPGAATPEQARAARSAVALDAESTVIDLVGEGRRKATLQVEKVVSERIVAVTRPLTEAVPLLEPLMQVFVEATDATVQERVARAYDRIMAAALGDPRTAGDLLGREATAIVAETDVAALIERESPRALQLAEEQARLLSTLRSGGTLIDQRVEKHLAARATRPPIPLPSLKLPKLLPMPKWPVLPYRPPPYTYRPPYTGQYGRPPQYTLPRPVAPRPAPRPPRFFVW